MHRPWPIDARRRARASAFAFVLACALGAALLAGGTAFAARIVDVRVGVHPGYARVVFETDAPAVHEIVTAPAATPGEVVVRIAAASAPRALPGRGAMAPAVVLEPQPDGTTLARIRAAGPVRVETQVLRAPPRLVLDLRAEQSAPATGPEDAVDEPQADQPPLLEALPPEAPAAPPAPESVPPAEPPLPPVAEAVSPAETPVPGETPPAAEPAPSSPPPPVVVVPLPRGVVVEPRTPPVESPPPAALAFDLRSLAVGAALGVGLALLGLTARRAGRAAAATEDAPETATVAAAPPEEVAPAPSEPEEPSAPDDPAHAPDAPFDAEYTADWIRMHQRLDARLADVAARLEVVAARQADLDRREGSQTHEIAAQRAAIARLQRALRPPPRPRKTGKDAG